MSAHSFNADIVIPPKAGAIVNDKHHEERNRNVKEIQHHGRMEWQKARAYGRRNNSELAIQRYKKIIGAEMHSRALKRQQQEAMIACGVLNKMTSLGMPISHRTA